MSVPPVVKKLSLSLLTLVTVLGIPAVWLWYTYAGPGSYAEHNDIKAMFEGMPNVKIIRMGGNEDITYEDIWANISIKSKGEMELFALTRKSFESPAHISLGSIGAYNIIVEGEGCVGVVKSATGEPVRSQFYGGAIDIGSEGTFARFFPFQVKNVQDAIARYDDICAVLAEWPVEPAKKHFQDKNGTDYYYYIKRIQPKDALDKK